MEIKSKVVKYGERKIVEIPKAIRDNFSVGEEIILQKITGKITKPTTSVRIIANKREREKRSPKKS